MQDLQSRTIFRDEYIGLGRDARCYFDGNTNKIYGFVDSIAGNLRFYNTGPIRIEILKLIINDAENRLIPNRPVKLSG